MIEAYDILIEPIITIKNKRVFLFFKPKELIQDSIFELKLKITNKSGDSFSGGTLENIELINTKSQIFVDTSEKTIPEIASQESKIVSIGLFNAFSDGQILLTCSINPKDKKFVKYYQKDKINNTIDLLKTNEWQEFLTVTSKYEINQRYTNYLLLFMTFILVIFTIFLAFISIKLI